MLSSVKFKFGSSVNQPALELETPPSVTIFVGPNNSGKSQALREIFDCVSGSGGHRCIIEDVCFTSHTESSALRELDDMKVNRSTGQSGRSSHYLINTLSGRIEVQEGQFVEALVNANTREGRHRQNFFEWYARGRILSLDGPSRIGLVSSQIRGDLKNPSEPFAKLFVDDARRSALRKIICDATSLQFVLDASEGDKLKVRFGSYPPPSERSLEDTTLDYMRTARGTQSVSDGVKAFTGILLQVYAGQPKIITVDEPEAFLHPSLAFTLGKQLARGANEERKHIFASTHSAHFLMGAIASGAEVNIIRLTYEGDVATARLLPSSDLKTLMNDPLLRSVGVLDGLFFDGVVVCEANADRAFYQEVNERLLAEGDPRGVSRTLFLIADNHQTVARIVAPLRKLGIPAASVVDLDVLKRGGGEWTRHLQAIEIPKGEHNAYADRRATVVKSLEDTQKNYKTQGGIALLKGSELETAQNLLDDVARYGLFIVPRGEIEAWLTTLDVGRSKGRWLESIFEKMGNDPNASAYVKPTKGDVWDFVGTIASWVSNKSRKGIPD